MFRRAPLCLVTGLALLLAAAGWAQEEPPEKETGGGPALIEKGTGTLLLADSARPLLYAVSMLGPLVALEPVVARLGGRLEVGALGQSYLLTIGEQSTVVAPLAAAITAGVDITPLSQPPQVVDGQLLVPIDLLERTFGGILGVELAWQAGTHQLTVTRPQARELPVEVDLVHLQGVSTLVLQFPERPRYRITRRESAYDVELAGDHLVPPARRPRAPDPLVRDVVVTPEKIHVELVAGAQADTYELKDPFRIVFDVYRAAPGSAVGAAPEVPMAAPRRREVRTIVVDPGHGGDETGAIGPKGSAEKDLTLAISQTLASRLEERLGVRVVLTRTSDTTLALDARTAIANQNKADLFVSVHLNSTVRGGARGAETYFLSLQASDQRAAAAAEAENRSAATAPADTGTGTLGTPEEANYDLQLILWDLAQTQHLAASQRLATLIQAELNQQLELKDRGVKQAPFRVLMGATMPAVLVELGFISTPEEESQLESSAYRAELVDALIRAIARYKAEFEGEEVAAPASAAPAAVAPTAAAPTAPPPERP